MKHLTLAAVALASLQAHAQPTLTHATNAPTVGTSYTLHYGAYHAPGDAGANATWDLTGLTSDSTALITFVDPATTPEGASFPDATVAQVGGGSTMYYHVAGSGVSLAGSVGDGVVIPYSDMGLYLPFPCTYQTTWSDTEGATFVPDGTPVTRTGTATGTADGHGTLVLPGGTTVANVLRVHWTETVTDATSLFSISYTFNSHLYYVPGVDHPLAQLVESVMNFNGFTDTVRFSQWVDELTLGAAEPEAARPAMRVWPNPASEVLHVAVPDAGAATLDLYDATGRKVRSVPATGPQTTLDVADLPAGLYIIEYLNDGLRRHAERIQVR